MENRRTSMPSVGEMAGWFGLEGPILEARSFGGGHINDTFRVVVRQPSGDAAYIVQRLNEQVFADAEAVMDNVDRVTRHIADVLVARGVADWRRRVAPCLPARDGRAHARDEQGGLWRAFPFIEGTVALDAVDTPAQAREVARAFGRFAEMTATLGGPRLHETIPDFHHTPKRLVALERAAEEDIAGRVSEVSAELDFVRERASHCSRVVDGMADGSIPERVTHNDTKINNVLLDKDSFEGLCVIDLDTTMPGSVLYDFGDMVRTAASTAAEDADAAAAGVSMSRFGALALGYMEGATFLNAAEVDALAFSGWLITLECGARFLTDYLNGDTYFKTRHSGHNLDRCRNQFAQVVAMETAMSEMEDLVAQARRAVCQ